jgi:penicillin-binding protein 2
MERLTRVRAGFVVAVFCIILGFFALKLYDMQVVETGGAVDNTKTFTIYTTVKAARGEILDRNGNILVTNRASYDLMFNHYVICSAENRNARLLELVQLCRRMEIEYTDHLPVSETIPYQYTLNEYSSAWQGYFQSYLTIKPEVDSDISAPLLMKHLREYYGIPETWSDADARAVIGIRYELDLRQGVTNLPNYIFLEDADNDQLSAILELSIPGLKAEATVARVYNTVYGAHILGYVGAMTADQWTYYKNLTYKNAAGEEVKLYSLDSQVGQTGLEATFEEYLHGVDGKRKDVVTVDGTVISSEYIIEPRAGQNAQLSIDLNLQATAEDSLEKLFAELRATGENLEEGAEIPDGSDAEGGAVVVMNVKTGQILACASYPTYDLSSFREDWNDLMAAPFDPMFNRALQATYPPGSTYKMSMVIAGIDAGIVHQYTNIYDKGVYTAYEGFKPKCLQYTKYGYGHEDTNAMKALEKSCNYYFYWLADHMDIAVMDATAKALGLGESTGVELFEYIGRRANPITKAALYSGDDARWYPADQILSSIGQSDNRFTPLQLCVYTTTLANRGVRYRASFLNRVVSSDYSTVLAQHEAEVLSKLTISDEAYAAYTEGMRLVALSGTAKKYFSDYPIPIAAKTGTAETGLATGSDNGAFVCYAPFDDPEIAIVVYGEKAGHGSTMAQIGKEILDTYFADEIHGDIIVGENGIA